MLAGPIEASGRSGAPSLRVSAHKSPLPALLVHCSMLEVGYELSGGENRGRS